jgi:hypothetical protein
MGEKLLYFKGNLKSFKGYISAILAISPTFIFLIFQPLRARRIYA